MSDLKVSPGDKLLPSKWNGIVDRLPGQEQGSSGSLLQMSQVRVRVRNTSGRNYDIGEIFQIGGGVVPDQLNDIAGNASYDCIEPVWHTDIDNLVVANEAIPDTEYGEAIAWGACIISTSGSQTGRYVMLDPSSLYQAIVGSSGFARVMHRASATHVICILGSSQNLWRYKLTQDSQAPAVTTARLHELDGTEFSTTAINLSDPLSVGSDEATDYEGYCLHAGNAFIISEGPCA